ncbi:MAG: prephenate dehydratase domain-containing protein [Alphaproteobacteria bacterium]
MSSDRVTMGYQGNPGSFSLQALAEFMLDSNPYRAVPYPTFAAAIEAFDRRAVDEVFLPVENNNSGRVDGMHTLLPHINGWIAGEHFLHVQQCLLVIPGATLSSVQEVWSQKPAIDQCIGNINAHKWRVTFTDDTALAAKKVEASGRSDVAAIASPVAGQIHGLINLGNYADNPENHTRFVRIVHPSRQNAFLPDEKDDCTTMVVVSSSLADNPVSLFGALAEQQLMPTRMERMIDGAFMPRELIMDLPGHLKSVPIRACLQSWKSNGIRFQVKGCFKAQPHPV